MEISEQKLEEIIEKAVIKALNKHEESNSSEKWLKSGAFMKKFGIGHHDTLTAIRGRKEVKFERRGKFWYYNVDSYLPS